MSATAANLVDYVVPKVPLRQWGLTVPFSWRKRLGFNGALLGAVVRKFADAVLAFYKTRLLAERGVRGQSGAVLVVQRTSSDLRLNPHVHAVFLDGVFHEQDDDEGEVTFHALPRLSTEDVAEVLEDAARRMLRYLRRRGLLEEDENEEPVALAASPGGDEDGGLGALAAAAASGDTPPADPAWRRGSLPAPGRGADFERHLSVGRGGFTLHAATRAGAMDERRREALLKYVLRPPIAQERVAYGPEGLVRIALKKEFSDGTLAVDMDPLSLLTRLCASVPPPRFHTVRYAGVLASASRLRSRIVPEPPEGERKPAPSGEVDERETPRARCRYRPWAELMMRTFAVDVLCCPRCSGRLRLVALMTEPKEIRRYLHALGEPTEGPARTHARGPPYWSSRVLRRRTGEVDAASSSHATEQGADRTRGRTGAPAPTCTVRAARPSPRAPNQPNQPPRPAATRPRRHVPPAAPPVTHS